MVQNKIKIFQRRDGSLIYCVSFHPSLGTEYVKKMLQDIPIVTDVATGISDSIICVPSCDFQFFNISNDQLKGMEIKPKTPAEPK
jgi:hypothetical protein